MQTGTDVSNMANVILESLYLLFVCFEMVRPEMSKIQVGFFLGSLCRAYVTTVKLMDLILSSLYLLYLHILKDA